MSYSDMDFSALLKGGSHFGVAVRSVHVTVHCNCQGISDCLATVAAELSFCIDSESGKDISWRLNKGHIRVFGGVVGGEMEYSSWLGRIFFFPVQRSRLVHWSFIS